MEKAMRKSMAKISRWKRANSERQGEVRRPKVSNASSEGAFSQKAQAIKHCKQMMEGASQSDREKLQFVVQVLQNSHYDNSGRRSSFVREFERRGTSQDVQSYILKNFRGSALELPVEEEEPEPEPAAPGAAPTPHRSVTHIIGMAKAGTNSLKEGVIQHVAERMQRLPDTARLARKAKACRPIAAPAGADAAVLKQHFANVSSWDEFDVFEVAKASGGQPLLATALELFRKYDLHTEFNIDTKVLTNFFETVEARYQSSNPYHNSTHAADVLQTLHAILVQSNMKEKYSSLQLMSAFVAAAVHDVDHPGVSNAFLIQLGANVARTYNDQSVLEAHHLATFFKIVETESCNIFASLTTQQFRQVRHDVIYLVLGTDMTRHVEMLDDFSSMMEDDPNEPKTPAQMLDILRMALHLADVSNPAKPRAASREWARRVMDEFFFQGDLERALGFPVSAECDREKAIEERVQMGFIDFILRPFVEAWVKAFPQMDHALRLLEDNYAAWEAQAKAPPKA